MNNKIGKDEGKKPVKGKESVTLSEEPENNSDNIIDDAVCESDKARVYRTKVTENDV